MESGEAGSESGSEYKTGIDLELSLLGRYLVHIARTAEDFSEIDHEKWREHSILIPPIF